MTKVLGMKKEKNTEEEASLRDGREQFRVVISGEANGALEGMLKRVTDGFESGSVTKSDLANYVFQNLQKFLSESDIKILRALHFDEKKVLGSLLKTEDELPEDLKKAIRAHYGIIEKDKKKPAKNAFDLPTVENVDNPRNAPISA